MPGHTAKRVDRNRRRHDAGQLRGEVADALHRAQRANVGRGGPGHRSLEGSSCNWRPSATSSSGPSTAEPSRGWVAARSTASWFVRSARCHSVLGAHLGPLVILAIGSVAWSVFVTMVIGPRVLSRNWFEHSLAEFRESQGNVATGFVCTSSHTMRDTARHKDNAGMEPSISRDERVARGKSARTKVPRSSHAELRLSNRRDPLKLLEEQAKTRLPKLLPIRYGRMARSPFGFVRGAAVVMAADLANTPTTGIRTQLCGDAHLKNFGLFATPERHIVFDANDFDETLPGPWEWDLKRLVASVELAAREDGFSPGDRRDCVLDAASAYRTAMAVFAQQRNLEVWYAHLDAAAAMDEYQRLLDRKLLERKKQAIAKARQRDSLHAFERLTEFVRGQRRIISRPPLLVPLRELANEAERQRVEHELMDAIARYMRTLSHDRQTLFRQFQFVELAHRVFGVGSVGTRCWIALFVGIDSNDPLVLQIKEAQSSVLERFAGASAFPNHGERVVSGQRLMQAHGDILLDWTTATGVDGVSRDYYLRQLHDWKGSFPIEEMGPLAMSAYGCMCAWTLARAHARSGNRVAIAAYIGSGDVFDRALAKFAGAYADQTERDHDALLAAIRKGRIAAELGGLTWHLACTTPKTRTAHGYYCCAEAARRAGPLPARHPPPHRRAEEFRR